MKNKSLSLILLCTLCLTMLLSACGLPSFGRKASVDTNNTVVVDSSFNMADLEGVYAESIAHRGVLRLVASDSQTASIVIDWPGSAFESAHWEMSGTYDAEKNAIVYNNAVMTEQTFDEQGAQSDRQVSSNGTGSFAVSGKNLVWTDDLAYNGSEPTTFAYTMSLSDSDMNSMSSGSSTAAAPAPSASPAVAATPAPTPTPVVTPTPTPTPTPVATPAPGSPVITKDPTDETVQVGGSCWFVANHKGAILARWHFVSPDGTDLQYDEVADKFPTLKIHNGQYDSMKLSNIPAELNGYRFYCRFSNNNGTVDSKSALLTVEGAGTTAAANANNAQPAANGAGAPKVTKDPTDETVKAGGSAWFVAKHTGAVLARWHFVSPDGTDYVYTDVANQFPQMKIVNGDQGTMQLQNIPLNANGWKVYCRYSNNNGTADTKSATITVEGAQPANTNTATANTATTNTTTVVAAEPADDMNTSTAVTASSVVVSDWTDTAELSEAISISGIDFDPPDEGLPEGTIFFGYRAKTGMIEADYSDQNTLTVRKSATVSGNDLIGDYSTYSKSWDVTLKGVTINCRGDGTTINAATFGMPGGYFSISYNMGDEGNGLTSDQLNSLINCMQ